jgi:hypothetical protein
MDWVAEPPERRKKDWGQLLFEDEKVAVPGNSEESSEDPFRVDVGAYSRYASINLMEEGWSGPCGLISSLVHVNFPTRCNILAHRKNC